MFDCVSIFGQYSDSDLSNVGHSPPSLDIDDVCAPRGKLSLLHPALQQTHKHKYRGTKKKQTKEVKEFKALKDIDDVCAPCGKLSLHPALQQTQTHKYRGTKKRQTKEVKALKEIDDAYAPRGKLSLNLALQQTHKHTNIEAHTKEVKG